MDVSVILHDQIRAKWEKFIWCFRVLEEIWIHKSYTKCVCVRRIVGKSPRGLKLNVLFPSVWKPWEQFYRQIKQNELNCLCKCMLAVLMRGKSWGKLITADHPWQTIRKRKSDLPQLDNHNHHCLCIQHRLGLSLQSLVISAVINSWRWASYCKISQNISQKVLYLTKTAKYNKKRPFIFGNYGIRFSKEHYRFQ